MKLGSRQNDTRTGITNLLIGFFGVLGAFLLLPRTVKFMVRRFFMSIISEVLLVVLSGLLTEKLVSYLSENHRDGAVAEHERTTY